MSDFLRGLLTTLKKKMEKLNLECVSFKLVFIQIKTKFEGKRPGVKKEYVLVVFPI